MGCQNSREKMDGMGEVERDMNDKFEYPELRRNDSHDIDSDDDTDSGDDMFYRSLSQHPKKLESHRTATPKSDRELDELDNKNVGGNEKKSDTPEVIDIDADMDEAVFHSELKPTTEKSKSEGSNGTLSAYDKQYDQVPRMKTYDMETNGKLSLPPARFPGRRKKESNKSAEPTEPVRPTVRYAPKKVAKVKEKKDKKKDKKAKSKLMKQEKKQKEEIESLDRLLEALYDAVSKAQRNIRINNINELNFYFPYDEEDEIRKPKVVMLKLPSCEGGEEIVSVPLYSLVNHHPLNIEQFNIKFKINMNMAKRVQDNFNGSMRHKKYRIGTDIKGSGKNVAEVELRCKVADTPEGISRVADSLNKIL